MLPLQIVSDGNTQWFGKLVRRYLHSFCARTAENIGAVFGM